jgi:PAS domain S-box-containing protein
MSASPARALDRLPELLDHAPCGFFSFADDGSIQLINTTLLELLGYEREELIGRHVERILATGTRIFYQTHWFPLLRLQGGAEEIFLLLRSRAGDHIGVLANAVRRERNGAASYDCVVVRVRERQRYEEELLRARRTAERANVDLAAQKRELEEANRQLEQLREKADEANRAKSAFLAVMSHELRTPLNAIAGYAAILEMGIHGPVTDAQREVLSRIARSQGHLLGLINEVLNLARIESGHVEYKISNIDVAALVAGVTPMIEPQLQSRGIGFRVEVRSGLEVRGDRDKAQQILLNLLSNAAKFTPAGGLVTVDALLVSPERVQIRVADTGIGIPEDRLPSVFEPFVQVNTSRTRTAEGTGLGLAISRDLARGMGGDLTAESTPGQGSTFTLTLPAAEA